MVFPVPSRLAYSGVIELWSDLYYRYNDAPEEE